MIHCFSVCQELYAEDDVLSVKYSIPPIRRQVKQDNGKYTNAESAAAGTMEADFTGAELIDEITKETTIFLEHNHETSDDDCCEPLFAGESGLSPVREEAPLEQLVTNLGALVPSGFCEDQPTDTSDLIIWQGSAAARTFHCRGWNRSDDEWQRRADLSSRRRDSDLVRCAEDQKFRTRLCNHWDTSLGTYCPMRKKNKCIFAHGPVELRVKEAKRSRWGKLVDKNGDNNNPNHSGGEDTYGAARAIESERKQEGKWNNSKPLSSKRKKSSPTK